VASETTEGKTAEVLNGLALDERYARTTSAGTSSYLTDNLGSTLALANSGGEPTTEYTYDPFGASTSTGSSSTNPYQYTGRENDDSGLQYNRARYYSPMTTRFASQDPLGLAGSGVNLYAYAGSDPIDYTDPSGYSFLEELGESVTGFGDAVSGGITREIRGGLGLGQPDFSSGAYGLGTDAGILAAVVVPGDEEAAALDVGEDAAADGEQFVYRLHGGEAAEYGHSWTTVDPRTLENPRDALGLPDGNTAEYLSTAKVRDWTGVEPRSALPLDGNAGGAPELLFPDPEQQLNIISTEPF
jgi:RHS repeat-associated protein